MLRHLKYIVRGLCIMGALCGIVVIWGYLLLVQPVVAIVPVVLWFAWLMGQDDTL